MITVTLLNLATGALGPIVSGETEAEIEPHLSQDIGFIEGSWDAQQFAFDLATSEIVPRVKSLSEVQADLWDRVKRKRAMLEGGTCMTPKGMVQCDEASRGLINGAITALREAEELGLPVAGRLWTMADNTREIHSPTELRAMGLAVGAFIGAVRDAAGDLRELIFANGVTIEQVQVIDIDASWPEPTT